MSKLLMRWGWLGWLFLGIACGGEEEDLASPNSSRFSESELQLRNDIVSIVNQFYLWPEDVPEVNVEEFDTPQALMSTLAANENDRFSFVQEEADFVQLFGEGESIGLGFSSRVDENGALRVVFVEPLSPAGQAGLTRGAIILTVNGVDPASIDNIGEFVRSETPGNRATLEIENLEGQSETLEMTSALYELSPVLYKEIIQLENGRKAGYLVYNIFITPGLGDLESILSEFQSAGVNDLILDLRYNRGGELGVASFLANSMIGQSSASKVFTTLEFNENNPELDTTVFFQQSEVPLTLSNVVILTTQSTCSASELMINGLSPFVNLVTIGDNTCGKPVGFRHAVSNGYVICPVMFRVVNADGETNYFEGLPVDLRVNDGIDRNFGDREENMLREAIFYLENGQFDGSARYGGGFQGPLREEGTRAKVQY